MSLLEDALRKAIVGEVRTDAATLCAYSVDASIYEIEPLVVVTPKDKHDVCSAISIAGKHKVPVIARGAATGITGGCIGKGIILDLSRHMNVIGEINIEQEYVICQPGVVQDELNKALAPYGYRLGPDTSTGNRATVGGMLANNAAGAHSLFYGKMVDHVLSVEMAMADGTLVNLGERPTDTEDLYNNIKGIRDKFADAIEKNFPRIPRRVSGYNLDELIKTDNFNLAKLIVGSEGTLGVVTEIKMHISPVLKQTGICIVHFYDMAEGMNAIPTMLRHEPVALEMIDDRILETAKKSPAIVHKMQWLQGTPQAIFAAEFQAPDLEEKLARFKQDMESLNIGYASTVLTSEQNHEVWDVRKAGLGLLLSKRTYSRAIAFLEDLSIPPEHLGAFIIQFREYLAAHGKEAGIYGHVGSGCMHIRPYIDLRDPAELKLMHQMMLDVSTLVLQHGGALSGEHGDGLVRTWLNEKMFGAEVYRAFCEIKAAFDPQNLLNPGKIVHGPTLVENLRLSPETHIREIKTFQDFGPEGGFALAADLCNGNAQCRKTEGLMCPSFQATGDEFDTTRARAQALRAVINGRWKVDDFTSDKVGSVMDLCLECKGCKTQCPSRVDMAKMKSEFLYQYQEKHGYTLRSRLFGNIALLYSLASPISGIFNAIVQNTLFRKLMGLFGIAPERSMPSLSRERFSAWKRPIGKEGAKAVVLFIDTYTEFNEPDVGKAAFEVLSNLGYQVITPPWTCCGRPLVSKGLLKDARKKAEALIDLLIPYAASGVEIVGIEPSCILTIADDFAGIVSKEKREQAQLVAAHCGTFDSFIFKHLCNGALPFPITDVKIEAKVHGHCHQKALVGMRPTIEVLKALPGVTATEIPSGCCGLAGSFGYEKEHYQLSMKIGRLQLFPAIENTEPKTIIIANGFSCRSQISHGTGRKAVHLAEFIASLTLGKTK